jgi:hypothetical protein
MISLRVDQLSLITNEDRILREFKQFHFQNPHVYQGLRTLALQLKRAGRNYYGIKALFEVLRYEHALKTISDDYLKLNNNYTALYARKLMEEEQELDGFFRLRKRIARHRSDQIV